jgi:uncharacterized protein YjiK
MISFLLILLFTGGPLVHTQPLEPSAQYKLKVTEPSDICFTADQKGFWIVGDEGQLSLTDLEGAILKTSPVDGLDYEGVYSSGSDVFVMEEVTRNIIRFDAENLRRQSTTVLQYAGGHNKAFECITWNPVRKSYITVTEKDPVLLWELNEQFQPLNHVKLDFARDISAATFARGHLWLLSDEESNIFMLDPRTFEVEESWRINIYNPEGLAVSEDGKVYVVSDDVATLYEFTIPLK